MIDDLINESKEQSGYDKEAYKKYKREQLDNAYKMIDESVEELKTNPSFFMDYLNIQSKFDMYTPRNAMLVAKQLPTAMQLKEKKDWIEAKISFKDRFPKKIIILEPRESYTNKDGKTVTPYNAKELIDVSETNTKPNTRSYDKKLVLQGLLSYLNQCSINIKAVDTLDNGKMCEWNKDDNAIYICRSEDYDLVIKTLATESAKINLFENTNEIDNDKAECIGYMISKKYGIDCKVEDFDRIASKFSTMEKQDIFNDLTTIKEIAQDINSSMGQYLDEKRKDIKNKDQVR